MGNADRGETTIVVSESDVFSTRAKLGCMLFALLLFGIVFLWSRTLPIASENAGTRYATTGLAAPQPPPAQFAALTQHTTGKPQAFVFKDGEMEIKTVSRKEDIPAEDLAGAVDIAPDQFRGISHVTRAGVFIFNGDIDVHVGDLDQYDQWTAQLESVAGKLKKVKSKLTVDTARGPPQSRRVYVIGSITGLEGPDLHGHASSDFHLLNLAVSAQRQQEYQQRQAAVARHNAETEEEERAAKQPRQMETETETEIARSRTQRTQRPLRARMR